MKYILHPGMLIRKIKDPKTGKPQVVRTYIAAKDLINLNGLDPKECETFDARKHDNTTDAKHIRVDAKAYTSVSDKAVGTPGRRNRKGLFSE